MVRELEGTCTHSKGQISCSWCHLMSKSNGHVDLGNVISWNQGIPIFLHDLTEFLGVTDKQMLLDDRDY